MKLSKIHITFLLVLIAHFAVSQVNFKAAVSKNRLGVNERFRVTYTINVQGADDFKAPNFQDFKLVAGLRQGSNFSMINGKTSFEQSYTYTLQPKSKGVFTIPPGKITYNGKTLTSNSLKITVLDAVELPKDPNDPLPIARDNIFLVTEVSKTDPYIGESISVVYKIYFDPRHAILTNETQSKPPSFDGFWNQNIAIKKLKEESGEYKGRKMGYYVIRKDVLIPQRAGKLKVRPMEVDISGVVALNRTDFFGQRLRKNVSMTLTAGNRIINVKELPVEGKPANFNGAVGNYGFSVTNSKNVLKANETVQVKVKVEGTGNLKLLSLPGIETPSGLEKYEPEHSENIKTRLSGLSGYVQDEYTIVPQFKGKYKIPPLSFSYFNPKEENYITLHSEPIILNVPTGKAPQEENNTTEAEESPRLSSENDIRYIQTKTKLVKTNRQQDFFRSTLFWVALVLPLLIIPIGIYLGKKKKEREGDIVGNKRRLADRLARKYLASAKKELGNKEPFYIALEKALHNYLKAKLQVETSEISKEKISNLLENKGVDDTTITRFLKVLSDCDFARYTPTSNLQMEKEYQNAKEIITEIDKQL